VHLSVSNSPCTRRRLKVARALTNRLQYHLSHVSAVLQVSGNPEVREGRMVLTPTQDMQTMDVIVFDRWGNPFEALKVRAALSLQPSWCCVVPE